VSKRCGKMDMMINLDIRLSYWHNSNFRDCPGMSRTEMFNSLNTHRLYESLKVILPKYIKYSNSFRINMMRNF